MGFPVHLVDHSIGNAVEDQRHVRMRRQVLQVIQTLFAAQRRQLNDVAIVQRPIAIVLDVKLVMGHREDQPQTLQRLGETNQLANQARHQITSIVDDQHHVLLLADVAQRADVEFAAGAENM